MTIIIEPTAPTLDEIEEKATTLYYTQKVNFEAGDEVNTHVAPIWKRLAKLSNGDQYRLRDVTTESGDSNIYSRVWESHGGTFLSRTATLAVLLEEGKWPSFDYGHEQKQARIDVWTELIGISEEAASITASINKVGNELNSLLMWAERGREAQELRGWYVTARTSRRVTTGWVVGGRGQTIHVLPDPLSTTRRIVQGTTYHVEPLTELSVAQAAAMVATGSGISTEPDRYTLKSATLQMIYPPDMARERRLWVNRIIADAVALKEDAQKVWETFLEWKKEADPIIAKDAKFQRWANDLGTKPLIQRWSDPRNEMRWVHGGREAFSALLRLTGLDEEGLRKEMAEEWMRIHPDAVLTDAERAVLVARPVGEPQFAATLANVMTAKHTGLAPTF